MIADRELEQHQEQETAGGPVDTRTVPQRPLRVPDTHTASAVARPSANPPLASATVLIGLAVVGIGLWVLRVLEREREDRIDVEEARAALAEAEIAGTIPWEQIKKEHGL